MIKQQLQTLSPTGQRTELYLYTLQALNLLRSTNAQRKALFLFSDGLAEDSSQKDFHSNLTDVARSYNIAIYSFSYQLKPNLSKGVEILRKLSLDTYGLLFETNAKLELPDNFARDIFTLLESGGTVIYDISSILSTGLSGQQAFEITWQTGENTFISGSADFNLIPQSIEPLATPSTLVNTPQHTPTLLIYVILSIIAGSVLLLAIVYWFWVRSEIIYAYLHIMNSNQSGETCTMKSSTLHIGRHSENDLYLENDSVSQHHAVIHYKYKHAFILTDLGSTNHTLVNQNKINAIELKDGDLIYFGEVLVRFEKNT
jgi:hypothetical protein